MEFPRSLKYTATHEWAKPEGGLVRIGVTDFAQEQLGDIVFLELPEVGREVEQGDPFGVIESVKAVEDLCAPVRGEVVEVNATLEDRPELVNEDPYGQGWIVVVNPTDPDELNALMDASAYAEHCEGVDTG